MRSVVKYFVLLVVVSTACSKPEGEGGRAKIQGKVFAIDYPSKNSAILDTFAAVEEDVYIIYGDKKEICDKVNTNAEGYYAFNYLTPGDYTILVYTRDPEKGDTKFPVERKITVSGKKDEVDVEDLYLYMSDKGLCSISGRVFAVDFANDEATKPDTTFAAEEDVYLFEKGSDVVLEKKTTGINGAFRFDFLTHKTYSVVTYSRNPSNGGDKKAYATDVTIDQDKRLATIGNVYVYKPDEGYATIKGRLFVKDYNTNLQPKFPEDNYYQGGEDIFIQRKGSNDVIDRIKSGDNGWFFFNRLSVGTYYIYALSKDTGSVLSGLVASKKEVQITIPGEDANIGDLIIIQ